MQVPYRVPGSQYVQWVDLYTRMAFERIVFLDGEIDDNTANSIVALLLYLDSEDTTKPIFLYINSSGERVGGDVSSLAASMAIYDTMQYIKSPVHTICMGAAASSAVLLLSSGAKGARLSLPNAEIVLSPQYGRSRGQATDIQVDAVKVLADRDTFLKIFSENTGRSVEQLAKDLDRRLYLQPQEAVEYGLIDRVLKSEKELPKPIPALV